MSEGNGDPIERLSLQPNAIVAERYRLVDRIGAGGMGSVWRATHVTLSHDVAIKFLQVTEVSPAARARFEREAKLAARLGEASRHITRVIDYGVFCDSIPYLVMEMLQGETLSQRVRRVGQLPLEEAARFIVQLCRALQVAHAAGVIHRDIKPSNVFLVESEFDEGAFVKLMDFGVAKSTVDPDGEEMTKAGTIIGTPGYMSPEQILSKRLDARTDLWGVAACLYRIVCGRTPFGQGGIAELGLRILATDPLPPSSIEPRLPKALDTFMEKALAKSAEERFQSARDFADALSLIAGGSAAEVPCVTTIVPLADEAEPPNSRADAMTTRRERALPPRRRLPTPLVGGLVAVVALFGVVLRARDRTPEAHAAEVQVHPVLAVSAPTPVVLAAPSSASAPPPAATVTAAPPAAPVEPKPKVPPSGAAKKKSASPPDGAALWSKRDEL